MRNIKIPCLKLGVTGGIGSGKTSVCKVFNVLGIPVFYADPEAKTIMDTSSDVKHAINSIAGMDLYKEGTLDRAALAQLIFNNEKLLSKVNALIHPLVFERFHEWTLEQKSPYVIMEAAILFESGASDLADKILTVVAPVDQRVARIIGRNKLTREQVMERIRNQMDDDTRIKRSDYVIFNSEDDMIIPPVLRIHDDIIRQLRKQTDVWEILENG